MFFAAAVASSLVPRLPSSCGSDEVSRLEIGTVGEMPHFPHMTFKSPSGSSRAESERATKADRKRMSE